MNHAPGYTLEPGHDSTYVLKDGETVNEFDYHSDALQWTWGEHLELVPCGNCGGAPHLQHPSPPIQTRKYDWVIHCYDCAEGTGCSYGATPEKAAEEWNEGQELQCPSCLGRFTGDETLRLEVDPIEGFEPLAGEWLCVLCHVHQTERYKAERAEAAWEEHCERKLDEMREEPEL